MHADWLSPYWFDEEAANKACAFFTRFLTHTKGELARRPLKLEPWQEDEIIRPLFGWKRRSDNFRRYRTAYIELPRKNGKSTLAAGIALLLLCADGEPGAEVYSAAVDKEQAAIVFECAKQQVLRNRALKKRVQTYRWSMTVEATASTYQALSCDADTKHGKNPSGIIFDELHASPNRDLWDVLTTATGARRQPLTVAITTAGWDRTSICWEQHEYARRVKEDPSIDPSFLPVIYCAEEGDDWTDPATWAKANPNLGVSIKLDYLAAECAKAKKSPSYENTFKRLFLNIWTEQDVRWLKMHEWEKANTPVFEEAALVRLSCYGGLDLSQKLDLTAWVLLFPPTALIEAYRALCRFFIPAETAAEQSRQHAIPYDLWAKQGLITLTPGPAVDYQFIRAQILADAAKFDLRETAFDPWNAHQLSGELAAAGLVMVECRQSLVNLSDPCKELERLVVTHKFWHAGNPVLREHARNASVRSDASGNIRPVKPEHGGPRKIDGITALVMALSRAMLHTTTTGQMIYY